MFAFAYCIIVRNTICPLPLIRPQIVELESQLLQSRARFRQYQTSMRADMLREISVAKKAALLKIIDSGTVTPELRQRAVKIAAVEDEMYDLKKSNADQKAALEDLALKSKMAMLHSQRCHEEKIEALEAELAEKSKSWAQLADMERREFQRQQELTSAQTTASKLVGMITELRTKLEASEDAKRKLQKAKIRNQHTMTMLEKQMSLLTAQLGGANNDAVAAANAAATASLSAGMNDRSNDLRGDYSDDDCTEDNGRLDGRIREERIESARLWSKKVLEERNANHVTSLQRQLQRSKETNKQTTDMLRRAMNRIRKMEEHQEEMKKEMSAKSARFDGAESAWSNSKEAKLVQLQLEARRKGEDLTMTRAQLGAIKEEHARLLEYLRARGITAPGGDVSSSSAMRFMSGFSSRKFSGTMSSCASTASSVDPANNVRDEELPYHRRTFKFSVAPSGMGGNLGKSMWSNVHRPSDMRNKSGFVPQPDPSNDNIQPPRGTEPGRSAEGWRKRISEKGMRAEHQQPVRPQSAPLKRQGHGAAKKSAPTSQRATTLKMIETMICSVKKREEDSRAKVKLGVAMHTVRPELDKQQTCHSRDADEKLELRTPAGGKPSSKKKLKKRQRKRPQSAAVRTRLGLAQSARFNRTITTPRLGISSEHHTRM